MDQNIDNLAWSLLFIASIHFWVHIYCSFALGKFIKYTTHILANELFKKQSCGLLLFSSTPSCEPSTDSCCCYCPRQYKLFGYLRSTGGMPRILINLEVGGPEASPSSPLKVLRHLKWVLQRCSGGERRRSESSQSVIVAVYYKKLQLRGHLPQKPHLFDTEGHSIRCQEAIVGGAGWVQ